MFRAGSFVRILAPTVAADTDRSRGLAVVLHRYNVMQQLKIPGQKEFKVVWFCLYFYRNGVTAKPFTDTMYSDWHRIYGSILRTWNSPYKHIMWTGPTVWIYSDTDNGTACKNRTVLPLEAIGQ